MKYIKNKTIAKSLERLSNQIYKLLIYREQNIEWQKLLETICEELQGMSLLLEQYNDVFFSLLCKLKGLSQLTNGENDYYIFRRTIFKCLGKIKILKNNYDRIN